MADDKLIASFLSSRRRIANPLLYFQQHDCNDQSRLGLSRSHPKFSAYISNNMTVTIEGRVAQANGRLKAANVGIIIELDGKSLYLRGTLPAKPTHPNAKPSQQRIPLKRLSIRANPAGIAEAEKEARKVGGLLARKEFSWEPYLFLQNRASMSIAQWIDQYKAHFLNQGKSETSWTGDYWKIYRRLPPDECLSPQVLDQVILSTQVNSKTRKRACMAIKALAEFAKLDYDPSHLAGNYSPKRVSPRDLPDDTAITQWFYRISHLPSLDY